MPESLTPELIELRDACQTFAAEHLVGSDSSAETRANIRAAAKAAGLFGLTQPTHSEKTPTQLALCVARESLAASNPNNMDSVFGPSAGVLGGVTGALALSLIHI